MVIGSNYGCRLPHVLCVRVLLLQSMMIMSELTNSGSFELNEFKVDIEASSGWDYKTARTAIDRSNASALGGPHTVQVILGIRG